MPYISCRMLSCLSLQYSRAGMNQRTHTLFWAKEGAKCRHNDTALHTNSLFYWSRSYQTWSVCVLYLNASCFHLSFFPLALPLLYFTGCQEWQWRHVCGVCLCVALWSSVHVCPCRSPELEQESDSISRLSRSGATERCVPFLSQRLSHTHTHGHRELRMLLDILSPALLQYAHTGFLSVSLHMHTRRAVKCRATPITDV